MNGCIISLSTSLLRDDFANTEEISLSSFYLMSDFLGLLKVTLPKNELIARQTTNKSFDNTFGVTSQCVNNLS